MEQEGWVSMQAKDNLLRVVRHDNPQWVPNGMEAVVTVGAPAVERPGEAGKNAFDVAWSLKADAQGGAFPTPDGNPITDLMSWREQITVSNLDEIDWAAVKSQADEVDRDACLVCGFVEMGLFERSYLLLGMEEALVMFLTESEEVESFVATIADYGIELIKRSHDAVDLDMVWYGDDWGAQRNLFLPTDTWRQVIKPHTQRIHDCMKQRDVLIDQHSCGRIEHVFPDIVDVGADIWNPCQPCNDLVDLKRRFGGRITFCGGIDSQFVLDKPGVTTEEVRAEVRRRIDELSAGGGYVAAPSHSVPYDQELIDAMNDELFV